MFSCGVVQTTKTSLSQLWAHRISVNEIHPLWEGNKMDTENRRFMPLSVTYSATRTWCIKTASGLFNLYCPSYTFSLFFQLSWHSLIFILVCMRENTGTSGSWKPAWIITTPFLSQPTPCSCFPFLILWLIVPPLCPGMYSLGPCLGGAGLGSKPLFHPDLPCVRYAGFQTPVCVPDT